MNWATFIEKLTGVQKTTEQLLDQLQAREADKLRLTSPKLADSTGGLFGHL